jgi:hypothetical protein
VLNDLGKWEWVWSDRSHPNPRDPSLDQAGIGIRAEGPMHLRDITFKNFNTLNGARKSCGIRFEKKFHFLMGTNSDVSGIHTIGES